MLRDSQLWTKIGRICTKLAKRLDISPEDSTKKNRNFAKDVLWDIVGDNMVNRIQQDFGKESQGYVRLSPILNPLYMGYTKRKGLIYKFDIRSSYSFNDNIQIGEGI